MLETVTLEGFPPIKSISISTSAEEAVRSASLVLVIIGPGVPVRPGQEAVLKASGDLILTGQARDVKPGHSGSDRTLTVSLVSRTVDATECSVIHPTGECLDKTLAEIGREFDALDIGIEDDGGLPVEARHNLMPGESMFSTIERRGRGRGILIHDTPEGKLKIATKPAGTHSGGLILGHNILNASSVLTERGRYSEVRVRGQATTGTKAQQLRGEAIARDGSVKRRRPLVLRHEGEATTDRMKMRADWQVRRGAGNATTATITVTGWRDAARKIWTENFLVYVEDSWIGIKGMMLIKGVTLNQDGTSGGTTATLQLTDPRALGGENPRGETSDIYSAPSGEAEFGEE